MMLELVAEAFLGTCIGFAAAISGCGTPPVTGGYHEAKVMVNGVCVLPAVTVADAGDGKYRGSCSQADAGGGTMTVTTHAAADGGGGATSTNPATGASNEPPANTGTVTPPVGTKSLVSSFSGCSLTKTVNLPL